MSDEHGAPSRAERTRPAPSAAHYAVAGQHRVARRRRRRAPHPRGGATAYAGRIDKIRLLSAGFDAYGPKPLDPADLVTVLASLARAARITAN